MRHLNANKKFSRTSAHRLAMWRNMTTSLILHERIQTTDEKAKELRGYVAKMITLAKKARALGDGTANKEIAAKQLHFRRQALSFIKDKDAVSKLFSELAERFESRPGGYTRILKVGVRHGDAAKMSIIELLKEEEKPAEKKSKKKTKAKSTTKKAAPKEKKAPKAKAEPVVEETTAPVEEAVETQAEAQDKSKE